jgi:hypothetical protein
VGKNEREVISAMIAQVVDGKPFTEVSRSELGDCLTVNIRVNDVAQRIRFRIPPKVEVTRPVFVVPSGIPPIVEMDDEEYRMRYETSIGISLRN